MIELNRYSTSQKTADPSPNIIVLHVYCYNNQSRPMHCISQILYFSLVAKREHQLDLQIHRTDLGLDLSNF